MKLISTITILFILLQNLNLLAQIQEVPQYSLPPLLISENGLQIKNKEDWNMIRRPEILGLFEKFVYGCTPNESVNMEYKIGKVEKMALGGKACLKEVQILLYKQFDTVALNVLIFIPTNSNNPIPLFLGLNFFGNQSVHPDTSITITESWIKNIPELGITNNKATALTRGIDVQSWPIEKILERGYGLATIYNGDIDPDFDDGFQNGVHTLYNCTKKTHKGNEWGTLSAWAYGLSRVMDYLETDPDIDSRKIAVIGHSRLGKAALWAGAVDQRFSIVISNNSGCGGAALARRKQKQTLLDINTKFPHWFCDNYKLFNDAENKLPVDQHMLISLIAPRAVYVASAENDNWADTYGEYLSMFHASEVYKLFGVEVYNNKFLPPLNKSLVIGKMGYHIRSGGHGITDYDWDKFLDFADIQYFK